MPKQNHDASCMGINYTLQFDCLQSTEKLRSLVDRINSRSLAARILEKLVDFIDLEKSVGNSCLHCIMVQAWTSSIIAKNSTFIVGNVCSALTSKPNRLIKG